MSYHHAAFFVEGANSEHSNGRANAARSARRLQIHSHAAARASGNGEAESLLRTHHCVFDLSYHF